MRRNPSPGGISHPYGQRRTRTAGIAVTAAVALAVTAACSPGGSTGGGSDESGDKTISYLYFTDGPDEKATRGLIADFQRQTGVKVQLEIVPYADLEQKLQARLSGGNPPDVARLNSITPYRGDLLDLKTQGQDIGGQFLDQALKHVTGPNKQLLGVPSDLTLNGPFVNVAQFQKAGVPVPPADKPWTWPQLVAAAKKVQAANKTPYAMAYDKSGHRFATMLSQYGTGYFGPDGKVALDPAKATAAVQSFVSMHQQGVLPKDFWLESGTKYEGANDIFLAQDAPVYMSGNWQVSQFAGAAKFPWAAAPNPCQASCGGFPGGKFMAGFQAGKDRKLAAQFIAFMNSKASQQRFAQTAHFLPTRKDLITSGVTYPSRGADMAIFLGDLKKTPATAYADNYNPAFDATAKATVGELAKAIAGQQTAAATVTKIRAAAAKAAKTAGGSG